MRVFLRSTLSHEIRYMIGQRLLELSPYLNSEELCDIQIPDNLLHSLERLAIICENTAEKVSPFLIQEAQNCLKIVDAFLIHMNQDSDAAFAQTTIGQIRVQSVVWLDSLDSQHPPIIEAVWELIKPVQPDHLEELENGVFEARWWKPVPIMDVEMLSYTPGIQIQGEPFEPKHLPGGLAVRFLAIGNSGE